MDQLPTEIGFLTLNCWGLKYGLSQLRSERLSEIGRSLASLEPAPHVVALQECWAEEDYHAVRRETRSVLPYGKFYHAGVVGAGLVILSRWPIEESSMVRFALCGRPTAFFRGDWYAGKGIACASIRFGPGPRHVIQVFNTHFHASHGERRDTYGCHRLAQAWELSKLVRAAVERGHLVVAMGDFSVTPMSLAYRLLTAHAPVRDTWRLLHPDSSLGPPPSSPTETARSRPVPSPAFNVAENGVTNSSILNTWVWTKDQRRRLLLRPDREACIVPPDVVDDRAKRIDYILAGYAASTAPALAPSDDVWVLRHASVGMVRRHPRLDVSLSDHFSVEAVLALTKRPPPHHHRSTLHPNRSGTAAVSEDTLTVDDSAVHSGAFLQTGSPTVSDFHLDAGGRRSLEVVPTDVQYDFSSASYDEILAVVHQYAARERAQQQWRAAHFFVAVVVSAGCLVAVCFSPDNYVAVLLMLLSTLGLVAGCVNGLLALLFFRSERRALREFEWEIMNAKAAAVGSTWQAGPKKSSRSNRVGSSTRKC